MALLVSSAAFVLHDYVLPASNQKAEDLKREIQGSGQHEILNWVCLAGAMEGRRAEILAYAETFTINSSKCVALFPPA